MAFCIDSFSINLRLQYNRFCSSKSKRQIRACQKKGYMIKIIEKKSKLEHVERKVTNDKNYSRK
jgi:hypothetical protein